MTSYRALLCALALSIAATTPVFAAEKKAPAAKKAPPGRSETLACRLGTEDRHARIAVVVIRGRTDSFAYYSKWKPRTCSIYLQRNRDNYSKWADSGAITTVNLEKGAFLIEHKPGEYHFIFRDIDRERYCGMDGVINGSLTIKRGSDQCVLDGEIMVEGTPLGEAHAAREPEGPLQGAGASDVASQAAPTPAAVEAPAATPEVAPAATPKTAPAATSKKPPAATTKKPPAAAATKAPAAAPTVAPAATPPAAPAEAAKPAAAPAAAPPPPVVETPGPVQRAPEAQKPAVSDTTSPPPPTAAVQKPAEPPASNPFSSFFRSLSTSRPPEGDAP